VRYEVFDNTDGTHTTQIYESNATIAGTGDGKDRFIFGSAGESPPGVGQFDKITKFIAGTAANADKIDLTYITGMTTIEGLIIPNSPSETSPNTINAHSIAWYQFGSETVVIADASASANHIDMEVVLNGATASSLSTPPASTSSPTRQHKVTRRRRSLRNRSLPDWAMGRIPPPPRPTACPSELLRRRFSPSFSRCELGMPT
jgi:hypothetical protein